MTRREQGLNANKEFVKYFYDLSKILFATLVIGNLALKEKLNVTSLISGLSWCLATAVWARAIEKERRLKMDQLAILFFLGFLATLIGMYFTLVRQTK